MPKAWDMYVRYIVAINGGVFSFHQFLFCQSHFVNSHLVNFSCCQFSLCQHWQYGNLLNGKLKKTELTKWGFMKWELDEMGNWQNENKPNRNTCIMWSNFQTGTFYSKINLRLMLTLNHKQVVNEIGELSLDGAKFWLTCTKWSNSKCHLFKIILWEMSLYEFPNCNSL